MLVYYSIVCVLVICTDDLDEHPGTRSRVGARARRVCQVFKIINYFP